MQMNLSVIIPCFNERRTIRMIVEKVKGRRVRLEQRLLSSMMPRRMGRM